MIEYLGEVDVTNDLPFTAMLPADFAMKFIEQYGQIDGAHHKAWVLDQVARILKGTKVTVKKATWSNGGKEYRYDVGYPSGDYLEWVVAMKAGEDGPDTYGYEEGIAP